MQSFEEQLNNSEYFVYTNKGISMMPLLREDKDIIVIQKIDAERCKKYDVVFFRRPYVCARGRYVLHRILRTNPDGSYWIVGDNCTFGENVQPENILGILTDIVRNGKKISVNDWRYKLYVYLWCVPYPLRFFILKSIAFLRRGGHFLKRVQ